MPGDLVLAATLPLIIETAAVLDVLALGTLALALGHRRGRFAIVGGALWGGVQVVHCVDHLAVDLGLESMGGFLHGHGLLTPMHNLCVLGLALLLRALAGTSPGFARRPRERRATVDQARSGA